MESETKKAEIRKRLFFTHYGCKNAPESIAQWFRVCPECQGKGTFSASTVDELGQWVEEYGPCDCCDRWGFIYTGDQEEPSK